MCQWIQYRIVTHTLIRVLPPEWASKAKNILLNKMIYGIFFRYRVGDKKKALKWPVAIFFLISPDSKVIYRKPTVCIKY